VSASSRERLRELLADGRVDLAEANLRLAQEAYPDLDVGAVLARVDELAGEASARGGGVPGVAAALREAGLRGDREEYDDPRNSFLNEVLERRRGLPIALAALTVAVAERIGASASGIGMPGHFIVADLSGPSPRYLDPFDAWAPLDEDACARLVARTAGVAFEPTFLRPVGARGTLGRMLANLRGSYMRRRRLSDALWTVELELILTPGEPALQRELCTLLSAVGRYEDAERVAMAYLAERPDAAERGAVRGQLDAIRDLKRRMN
jgi:regulator of sirC expression with transglutaminase-like and TPR domain